MQAAELCEERVKPAEVARRLRVSVKSAYLWHQLWRDGGREALVARGPSGEPVPLVTSLSGETQRVWGAGSGRAWLGGGPGVDRFAGGHADRLEVSRVLQRRGCFG
ncbi:helix-turn-helix domain-containing protein [Streptomyces sp900105245]|uniref:Helix-turn-helix domain-containing protein n=1 Tax=Streptomyces sp. 900105245 TaxID=3154379 RepID=A0ABV1ULN0_9ACTN